MASVTLDGQFGFEFHDGKFEVSPKNLVIDGLDLPKFGWAWIGLSVAQGALMGVGSLIVNALVSSCQRDQNAELAQMLSAQLALFNQYIRAAIADAVINECVAETNNFLRVFREYENDPNAASRDYVLNQSGRTLDRLSQLGLVGYRTYMSLAAVRLAALQERFRSYQGEAEKSGRRKNCEQFVDEIKAFHNQIRNYIDDRTQPYNHYYEPGATDRSIYVGPVLERITENSSETYQLEIRVRSAGKGIFVLGQSFAHPSLIALKNDREEIDGRRPLINLIGDKWTRETVAQYRHAPTDPNRHVYSEIKDTLIDWNQVRGIIDLENCGIGDRIIAKMTAFDYDNPPRISAALSLKAATLEG